MSAASAWVTIPVGRDHFRKLTDPQGNAGDVYYAYVAIRHLPTSLSLETDPREPNLKSSVAREIRESLLSRAEDFHLLNRGITVSVEEVDYDNRNEQMRLRMPRLTEHGVLDGGHTYRVIEEAKRLHEHSDPPPAFLGGYVKLEILTGVEEMITDLAEARNTSAQVKPFAIDNLADRFDWIKEVLDKASFGSLIGYKENEDKPVTILEVIALLTLFHPRFQSSVGGGAQDHPITAYRSRQQCLDLYREEFLNPEKPSRNGYYKLKDVMVDILSLADYVHVKANDHLYRIGGVTGIQKRKKGAESAGEGKTWAKLSRTQELGGPKKLHFLGTEVKPSWPSGFVFPMIGSLRAILNTKSKMATWERDPRVFFDTYGQRMVEITFDRSRELGRNPNAVGKSRNHWEQLFTLARLCHLEHASR